MNLQQPGPRPTHPHLRQVREVTAPLIPEAASALDYLVFTEDLSETDVVNRALQAYELIRKEGPIFVRDPQDPHLLKEVTLT